MAVEYFLALGLTMLTCSLTVFLRDIEYILGIVMMAWQFLSPVMYGIDMVPQEMQGIMSLNPMTSILMVYRDIFYYKQVPDLRTLAQATLLGVIFMLIGFFVFEKLKRHFSEEM